KFFQNVKVVLHVKSDFCTFTVRTVASIPVLFTCPMDVFMVLKPVMTGMFRVKIWSVVLAKYKSRSAKIRLPNHADSNPAFQEEVVSQPSDAFPRALWYKP